LCGPIFSCRPLSCFWTPIENDSIGIVPFAAARTRGILYIIVCIYIYIHTYIYMYIYIHIYIYQLSVWGYRLRDPKRCVSSCLREMRQVHIQNIFDSRQEFDVDPTPTSPDPPGGSRSMCSRLHPDPQSREPRLTTQLEFFIQIHLNLSRIAHGTQFCKTDFGPKTGYKSDAVVSGFTSGSESGFE